MSLPTTGRAVGGTPPDCSWATPILHADLDAFYASVEALRDPSLRGRPVIVGGTSSRGVVTSASYEARRAEVASGMPTSRARRLCPEGIFLAPDFELYRRYSNLVREVFDSFSPVVEPLSLDEAFLDVSGARRMWPDPSTLAEALRARVAGEVGLAVSVGVAPNKFLAKVASKRAKPDGLVVVAPEVLDRFLYPLGVEELWGVGEITAACLRRLGLRTIGDVGKVPAATLERALGSLGREVARLAAGKDDRPVTPEAPRKSMGAEETFEQDLVEEAQVLRGILRLSDRLSSRLRAHGASGQTVTLKVRFSNYATVTRSKTLPHEVDAAIGIYLAASDALPRALEGESPARKRIRLLGISISSLKAWPASEQLSLDRRPQWAGAGRAIDRIRRRFGKEALAFASLLEDG